MKHHKFKKTIFSAFLLFSILMTNEGCSQPNHQSQIEKNFDYSTVYIIQYLFGMGSKAGSTGTCFSILYKGKYYLVTASHVLLNSITNQLPKSGDSLTIVLLSMDKKGNCLPYKYKGKMKVLLPENTLNDFAILVPENELPFINPQYKYSNSFDRSQTVYLIGFPNDSYDPNTPSSIHPSVTTGIFSEEESNQGDYIRFQGKSRPGFSGGPIVVYDQGTNLFSIIAVNHGTQSGNYGNGPSVEVKPNTFVGYSVDLIDQIMKKNGL